MSKTYSSLISLLFCFIALLTAPCTGQEEGEQVADETKHVVVLNENNIDEYIKNNDYIFIKFFARWCEHCKRMADAYEETAKIMKEKGAKIVVAEAECNTEMINTVYDIDSYPTIRLYVHGVPTDYAKERTSTEMVNWLEEMAKNPVNFVTELREITEDVSGIVYVGVFPPKSEMIGIFQQLAESHRTWGKFAIYSDASVTTSRVYVKKYDEGETDCTNHTYDGLKECINTESFPRFGPINDMNFRMYAKRGLHFVWVCCDAEWFEKVKSTIRKVAEKYEKDFSFVWLNTSLYEVHAKESLGISQFPAMVIRTRHGSYEMPNASNSLTDASKIEEFIEEARNKSEPIPEADDEPVKVVVGKNFREKVFRSDKKDVFLQIYSPTCGHCQRMSGAYKEFAEMVQDENIVVTKIDGTANTIPNEFDYNGYPAIFFVNGRTNEIHRYSGERSASSFNEFYSMHKSDPSAADEL